MLFQKRFSFTKIDSIKVWGALLVTINILLVCLFCMPTFKLHFFWDEAWVYGPAIKKMVSSGLSILPSALPEDISRGHPLLFHFIYSIIPTIFGTSNFILHLSAFCLNALWCVGIYFILSKLTNSIIAVIGLVFLLMNNIILAQIGLILPEFFLGSFIIYSIYFYSVKNYTFFIIFCSLALLIKESALILPISIWLFEIINTSLSKEAKKLKKIISFSLIIGTCGLPIGLFLLIQYFQRGYFFFPEHLGLIEFSFKYFRDTFSTIYRFLFEKQGRYFISMGLFFVLIFSNNLSWKLKILNFFLAFAMVKIFFRAWRLGNFADVIVLPTLFACFYFLAIYKPLKLKFLSNETEKPEIFYFLNISFIFSILFFLFSSFNFFTLRYTLPIVFVLVSFCLVYIFYINAINHWIKYSLFFVALIPVLLYNFNPKESIGDTETTYKDALLTQQNVYNFIVSNNLHSYSYQADFTNEFAFKTIDAGLVKDSSELIFNIDRFNVRKKDFIIQNNYNSSINLDTLPLTFDTIFKTHSGKAKSWILKKNN